MATVRPSTARASSGSHPRLRDALAWLEDHATAAARAAPARYGIVTADRIVGVTMADLKRLGKDLGRDHALAEALWRSEVYEARLLTAFVADPARLSAAQMDRWCRQFDNWAYPDTLAFHLFDRTPHAWAAADKWSRARGEFAKRAAFALLWSLALHDQAAVDGQFLHGLTIIEAGASDDRHFVSKAVNMALRAFGRRGPRVHGAAVAVAERLAASPDPAPRWVGRDALRTLAPRTRPAPR